MNQSREFTKQFKNIKIAESLNNSNRQQYKDSKYGSSFINTVNNGTTIINFSQNTGNTTRSVSSENEDINRTETPSDANFEMDKKLYKRHKK